MTSLFQCQLLNQPFGDPALYVRLMGEKKALLFDLGDLCGLNAGKLFKVTHVYVSHTHMDHFIGFDHLVRLNLAREKKLTVYGPRGIIGNVKGKLKGYTWNLVDSYPFVIEVVEIGARILRTVQFVCRDRFKPEQIQTHPWRDVIDAYPHYTVKALRLDHKICSLAYGLEERFHININKDRLERLGLPPGRWLRIVKEHIWRGAPDTTLIGVAADSDPAAAVREIPLGMLKKDIVTITRGQKIVYVSDCRGTAENFKKLIPFCSEADLLFCEAAFLEKDQDKAVARGHLTAAQAGFIARTSGVKDLRVFHFSPRYEHVPELLYQEAAHTFSGS